MKTTLLQVVQSILSDMDSEEINSISDTVEAQQIASVVEDSYYNIIAARDIPEHNKLLALTAQGDSTRPTHFRYPDDVKKVERVDYNIGTAADPNYTTIHFVDHETFLDRMNQDGLKVETIAGSIDLFVSNDRAPSYYTSFDDYYVIMDSYDAAVESTLQQSKIRAFGSAYPTFEQVDGHLIDLDNTLMPYLLAEAKSTCFSLFKGGSDPKIEQSARRLKSYVQNDMYKTKRPNIRNNYGR